MADECWKKVGDYVTLQRGNTYSGMLVGKPGPALLGLGSIEPGGGFRSEKYKTFGGECPAKIMLASGDTYVALKGATKDGSMVGSVARLPENISSGRLTQDTARLDFFEKNPEIANHLYWVLRTPQYRQYCNGRVTGSASASFSREDFLSYTVPPISNTSKRLVCIFEAVEKKIELNRRMSVTLEAMARALFQSWFVDFDLVRAKLDHRLSQSLDKVTAALFPAGFQESPVGPIPRGWTSRSLYDTAKFTNGAAFRNEDFCTHGEGLPVVKIAELKDGIDAQTKFSRRELDSGQCIDTGDLLYSWSGMGVGRDDKAGRMAYVLRNWEFFHAPVAGFVFLHKDLGLADAAGVGMFLENFLLALTERGIGSCVQVSLAGYPEIVRSQLSVPAELNLLCGMSIGYADPDYPMNKVRAGRQPIQNNVRFVDI